MTLAKPKRLRLPSYSHLRSKHQEVEVAESVRGRVTKASGATDMDKGDVRVKGVTMIEAKTTARKSFSVTMDLIEKLDKQSAGTGDIPAMVIEINNKGYGLKRSVAVVPLWALEHLVNRCRDASK